MLAGLLAGRLGELHFLALHVFDPASEQVREDLERERHEAEQRRQAWEHERETLAGALLSAQNTAFFSGLELSYAKQERDEERRKASELAHEVNALKQTVEKQSKEIMELRLARRRLRGMSLADLFSQWLEEQEAEERSPGPESER